MDLENSKLLHSDGTRMANDVVLANSKLGRLKVRLRFFHNPHLKPPRFCVVRRGVHLCKGKKLGCPDSFRRFFVAQDRLVQCSHRGNAPYDIGICGYITPLPGPMSLPPPRTTHISTVFLPPPRYSLELYVLMVTALRERPLNASNCLEWTC